MDKKELLDLWGCLKSNVINAGARVSACSKCRAARYLACGKVPVQITAILAALPDQPDGPQEKEHD